MAEPAEFKDRWNYAWAWEARKLVWDAQTVGLIFPLVGLLFGSERWTSVCGFVCAVFGFACERLQLARRIRRLVEPDHQVIREKIKRLYGHADVAIAVTLAALVIAPAGPWLNLAVAALSIFQWVVLFRVEARLPEAPLDLKRQWKIGRDGVTLVPANRGPAQPPLSFSEPEVPGRSPDR